MESEREESVKERESENGECWEISPAKAKGAAGGGRLGSVVE